MAINQWVIILCFGICFPLSVQYLDSSTVKKQTLQPPWGWLRPKISGDSRNMDRSIRDKIFITALALLFVTTFIIGWLLLHQTDLFLPLAMTSVLLMLSQAIHSRD